MMKVTIIVKNAIRCKHCGDIIESTYRHDFKFCSCQRCAVDGKFDTTSEYAGIYDCSDNNYVAFGKLYELIMEKYAVNTPNNTLQEGVEYYLLNVVGVTQTEINSIKHILLD